MDKNPSHLKFENGSLNFAGQSRTPGGLLYINHAEGAILELFPAEIVRTGMHFSIAKIHPNPALGTVRIDAAAFAGHAPIVGSHYLIGPLSFTPRPKAAHAFPLRASTPTHAPAVRESGVITDSGGGYGFIRAAKGDRVFVPVKNLEQGAQLVVGLRVTFIRSQRPKGPVALTVRPAFN